jgi:hypothetical protein
MSIEGALVWTVIPLVQLAAAVWVVMWRRGMLPWLMINLLMAVAVLALALPYVPHELTYIRSGAATELLDYLMVILTTFESVTIIASILAFWCFLAGKIVAWFGFVGNFVLSLGAAWFFLSFRLTRLF